MTTKNDGNEKLDLDEGSINIEQADCQEGLWPKKKLIWFLRVKMRIYLDFSCLPNVVSSSSSSLVLSSVYNLGQKPVG